MRCALVLLIASLPAMLTTPLAAAPPDDAVVSEATQGRLKSVKGEYLDPDFNASVDYDAALLDLNGDGQAEVFTRRYGGMFGRAGMELNLYIKNKSGQWVAQFGFPGDYALLKTKNRGYPDIEIQGPGTCFPVWRWNGAAYALHKRCAR